jgi:hypothetical protein
VDITAELREAGAGFDEDGLVTALIEVTAPLKSPVKVDRVGGVKALHKIVEVGFLSPENEMKMIIHENIRMHFNAIRV